MTIKNKDYTCVMERDSCLPLSRKIRSLNLNFKANNQTFASTPSLPQSYHATAQTTINILIIIVIMLIILVFCFVIFIADIQLSVQVPTHGDRRRENQHIGLFRQKLCHLGIIIIALPIINK